MGQKEKQEKDNPLTTALPAKTFLGLKDSGLAWKARLCATSLLPSSEHYCKAEHTLQTVLTRAEGTAISLQKSWGSAFKGLTRIGLGGKHLSSHPPGGCKAHWGSSCSQPQALGQSPPCQSQWARITSQASSELFVT